MSDKSFGKQSFRPLERGQGETSISPLHKQAADLLTSQESSSAIRSMRQAGQKSDAPSSGAEAQGPKALTASEAHNAAHNKGALSQTDGDQAAKIVETNPTHESVATLVDRNASKAIEMCLQQADVAAVTEHNDDLGESFHRQLKLAQTGFED